MDIIGARNGILQNGASFAAGRVGAAFGFDGSNDFVAIADAEAWAFGVNAFTIDLWVKFDTIRGGSAGTLPNVLLGHDEGGGNTNKWVLFYAEGGLWFLTNSPALGAAFLGPVTFSPVPGQWHHFALTRSSETYTYYADGVAIGFRTDSRPVPNANAPLTIGQAEGLGFFDGLIDEIEIYNRALASSEIQAIFAAGEAGKCKPSLVCTPLPTGLVSWLPGEGNAQDIVGLNHGTPVGAGFAVGLVGSAFAFDGLDDYVSLPPRPVPEVLASQFTIEFWTNPGTIPDRPTFGFLGSGISILLNPLVSYDGGLLVSDTRIFQSVPLVPIAPANTWTHYAIVDDGSFYRLYVNGVEHDNAAVGVHPSNPLDRSFVLGQSGFDEPYANPYQGRIDEFTIYSVGLSPAQITGIVNAGSAGKCRNAAPTISSFGATPSTEGAPVTFAVAAFDSDGDTLTYSFDVQNDGTFDITGSTDTVSYVFPDDFVGSARVRVSDGGASAEATTAVTVTNAAPSVAITGPATGSVYTVGSLVTFTGAFTDAGVADTHTAIWTFNSWDTAITLSGTVTESLGSGSVTNSFSFGATGVYLVTLRVSDDDGGITQASTVGGLTAMIVVYNPDGGFVTGGGWIESPPGAYAPDPSLTGRAIFGFVSKYERGATTPSGETHFRFIAAGMQFRSSSYEWLVVAGPRAQYKGTGTFNGGSGFGFLLTAVDGDLPGGGESDRFRIKIWDLATGFVIYDNQPLDGDNADPTTAIGGGRISISAG